MGEREEEREEEGVSPPKKGGRLRLLLSCVFMQLRFGVGGAI
jgi:hypothetical protein